MKHGSLFSGIGGFDLAAEWMGWENKFHCEWNPFGQKVLKHYWPNAETFTDITKSDFKKYNGTIDIISGGFPCQPYSAAGLRKGKEDERHLWPHMCRAIREVQPSWVVGENVAGLLNWNGGVVLDEIKADLENSGFEVFPPCVLPACGVNAPHRRDRVWIVAHRRQVHGEPATNNRKRENSKQEQGGYEVRDQFTSITKSGDVAHPFNEGLQGMQFNGTFNQGEQQSESFGPAPQFYEVQNWDRWPTEQPFRSGDDGFSSGMAHDTISKSQWHKGSLEAAGNAIVPQVALQIFKAIEQYEML